MVDIPLDTVLRNPLPAGTEKRGDGGNEGDAGGVWEKVKLQTTQTCGSMSKNRGKKNGG